MKAKSIQLFNLFDELNEQVNNVMHDAVISKKRNRLDMIDQGAKEAERIIREIQMLVNSMRRKKVDMECQK
ncbi:hypothetical protein NX081_11240 [Bacillus velezensis]|uniref:hypothetical protein n=1 Tax=Bacillus TaxID=1386 RepID=UPI000396A5A2|nr:MULTISPECIES: hypothetical protein [Bacillus]ERH59256.1 hypothetical protein O205_01205 [Bacillus amyloliquefaciens EGD-AQ14]MCX2851398.1 hypothetical protein [Bacillus sp. KeR2]UWD95673.1 hypothetical protein NX081_11240 [Bacillus velezensis]